MRSTFFAMVKHRKRPGVVGVNLLRLRKQAGLSQEKLAERSGVHRVTIASIESGEHGEPDFGTIDKLARGLAVRVADLTEGATDSTPIAEALDTFKSSPWGQIDRPSENEEKTLRELPGSTWINIQPTPETIHHMLLALRASRQK